MWGTAAITAVTAQNTLGVQAFEAVTPELVRAQIASVAADFGVDAAKTGMLASAEVVEAVATTVAELGVGPLVVDPVLVSKHGDRLLAPDAVDAVRALLLPLATVLTPNLPEAEALVGFPVRTRADMEAAARALVELGRRGGAGEGRPPGRRRALARLPAGGRRRRRPGVARRAPACPDATPTAPAACCRPPSRPGWPRGWSRPTPAWPPSASSSGPSRPAWPWAAASARSTPAGTGPR